MIMDYNLLKIFNKVAQLGSFTQAARALNQPKSRVSRSVARLENELGVQLIRRTTRRSTLTASGEEFYSNILPLLDGIHRELMRVNQSQQEMSGVIRVTASQDIGQTLVAKLLTEFNAKYPKVVFETIITNELLDLNKENIDVAFRAGKLQDSTLLQKKILNVKFIIVASKQYVERFGAISNLLDLRNRNFYSFKGMEKNFLADDLKLKPLVTSDSIPMILNMVLNHGGIAILPDFFCEDLLAAQVLVRLLPSWESGTGTVHALYPANQNRSIRVKAFIDLIASYFNNS